MPAILAKDDTADPTFIKDENDEEEEEGDDEEEVLACRLKEAIRLFEDDKIFEAGRVLRQVMNRRTKEGRRLCLDLFNNTHALILKQSELGEKLVAELKSGIVHDAHEGWIYSGHTSLSNFHTRIYYKLENHQNKQILKCRLETPIAANMVIPILSVFNESELYTTWMPHWSIPRLQFREIRKLGQVGRVGQSLLSIMDIPWPMATREVVINARAFDDVETRGEIFIHVTSDEEEFGNLVDIPPPDKKHVRMGFESSILFRSLPLDYPLQDHPTRDNVIPTMEDQPTILLTCSLYADPKLSLIPQPLLNFATRIAIGTVWNQLLQVSLDVKDGKRPAHSQVIEQKQASLYDWAHKRVELMISASSNNQEVRESLHE